MCVESVCVENVCVCVLTLMCISTLLQHHYYPSPSPAPLPSTLHPTAPPHHHPTTPPQAAGTLEDSASALHEPQDRLEACSLPELVPGAEDGSLVDGSIADIVEPSVVESSGVGSRVSGTAGAGGARDAGRGRGGGVYRHHKGLHHASPVPEGMLEGSAEDSGLLSAEHEEEGEDDLVDGTISDILSSYMSELTLSSNASSGMVMVWGLMGFIVLIFYCFILILAHMI